MNDPRELVFGQETFAPLIFQWIEMNFPRPARAIISAYVIRRLEYDATQNGFFSASFCPDPENSHLWAEYSENNTGISIGFHPAIIDNFGRLDRVFYVNSLEQNFREKMLRFIDIRFTPHKAIMEYQPRIITMGLMELYLLTKEKRWENEREDRVIWAQTKPGFRDLPPDSRQKDGQPRYWPIHRRGESKNIEYIIRGYPDRYYAYPSVREVVLGSQCSIEEKDVAKLLIDFGYPPIPVRRIII